MRTNQEWEEHYLQFDGALKKLDDAELQKLCFIFECYPEYVGEVQRHHYTERLWTKFREWRRGADDALAIREALGVLRLR